MTFSQFTEKKSVIDVREDDVKGILSDEEWWTSEEIGAMVAHLNDHLGCVVVELFWLNLQLDGTKREEEKPN